MAARGGDPIAIFDVLADCRQRSSRERRTSATRSSFGLAAFAVTVPQQHRMIALAPSAAPLAVALNASGIYLAVFLSGAIGGIALNLVGHATLCWLAAAFIALGLAVSQRVHEAAAQGTY